MTEPALAGRVALVTGSSRGIGAAIAAEFARLGAAVVVHGRDQAATSHVAGAIASDGGPAITATGDLTDYRQVESVRRRIEDAWGRSTSWSRAPVAASPRPRRSRRSPKTAGGRAWTG